MYFEWDQRKAEDNLEKHGVSFAEASTVFGDPLAWSFPDPEHSFYEERWLTIGLSSISRVLVVIHTEVSEDTIRIISARKAKASERRQYEQG